MMNRMNMMKRKFGRIYIVTRGANAPLENWKTLIKSIFSAYMHMYPPKFNSIYTHKVVTLPLVAAAIVNPYEYLVQGGVLSPALS
jgi:hypothetical protein